MKKIILTLAVATAFLTVTILTGCQSSVQKEASARDNVKEAKQDLKKVQADANEEAQKLEKEQEWETFKSDAEITIRNNEIRIGELRVKLRKEGKILDPMYEKKIETLEQQNKDLKKRIEDYEKNQSDWEIFKREFNHDMDELGKALKGLTVDNKN
jgi:serine phosphatase RsbU (regulator of sigma subunit)